MTNTFTNTAATLELVTGYALEMGPGTGRWVTDIQGWHKGAPLRRDSQTKPNRHGTFAARGYKDARMVTVSGHFTAATRAEAAAFTDEINACMADGTQGVLTVDDVDQGVRWAEVYLREPDVTWNGGRDVSWALDMEAPDPRKFGALMAVSTGRAQPGGGMVFDLFTGANPGIMDFGEPGETGAVQIHNSGKAPADPVLRVQGPPGYADGGDFKVTEVETGRVMQWRGTILTGQELVLDSRYGTVLLEGTGDRKGGLIRNQWPEIPGGQTRTYQFETDSDLTLILEAAPAWW